MPKQQRDLQKLYKFANDRNIVIEEVTRFTDKWMLGQYCGRFDFKPADDPDYLQDIHVKVKQGMYPSKRMCVIAHEIGHDKMSWDCYDRVARETSAWEEGEKLLHQLNISIPNIFYRLRNLHLLTLRRLNCENVLTVETTPGS